mgnify:CR=1 FL=1
MKKMPALVTVMTIGFLIWMLLACRLKHPTITTDPFKKDSYGFSRRSDRIFFHEEVLDQVDANSFEVLDANFCKDQDRVFYFRNYRDGRDYFLTKKHSIENLQVMDVGSFTSLGYGYAKESKQAWFENTSFTVSDIHSLMVIDRDFIKDNHSVYVDRKLINGIEGKSFELIDHDYAKDNHHYYYLSRSEENEKKISIIACDYQSYIILDYPFSKDAQYVYFEGKKINGVNGKDFVVLGHQYGKDHHAVYFQSKQVMGADPATFSIFPENAHIVLDVSFAKDKNHIYINEKQFQGVDIASFKILNEKYTLDKNGIYYQMKKIKHADPASFAVYPHFVGDADAYDKNHQYGEGKIVQ